VDTHKLLNDFICLLTPDTADAPGSTVEAFLSLLGPEIADAIRRSAIPHEMTPNLLQVLVPNLDAENAVCLCGKIASYSFATPDGDGGFSFHDQTRQELFDWWLRRGDGALFARLSLDLVTEYSRRLETLSESNGELFETLLRKRMYHLMGADQSQGFTEFQRLFSRARYQRRFSECAALVKLVRDYDPVLIGEHTAWLTYHEGKLAADRNQSDIAQELFQKVLEMSAASSLTKAAALMRLGNLRHRASDMNQAKRMYAGSLELAESDEACRCIVPRIKHDHGVVYRDSRDWRSAQALLEEGLGLAKDQSDLHIQATILNSLGRLHMDTRRFDDAIMAFEQALAIIESNGERFEVTTLCSNLANAYMERGNYDKSYELYERSLKLSVESSNCLGQAEVLNNLARVLRAQSKLHDAISMFGKASTLFLSQGDRFRAGVAIHNQARCYRNLKKIELSEKSFQGAMELFRSEGATTKLTEIEAELRRLRRKERPPWMVWVCALLFLLLVLLMLIGMVVGA
jgi:tetratricopeptide (TPR) repeat protein